MSILNSPKLLRYALFADALASGATALLLLFAAGFLTELLGLPEQLMRAAGWILVPFVGLVGYLATREHPSAGSVWAVILLNVAWVAASILLLFTDFVSPTVLGYAFVVAQAAAVFAFADLQFLGLRRTQAHA